MGVGSISAEKEFPELSTECSALSEEVLKELTRVVSGTRCDCIALSGGIDTAVIAAVAKRLGLDVRGYSVVYLEGVPRDLPYVNWLEKAFGFRVNYLFMDRGYVRRSLRSVKACVHVEDDYIELRNDLVFYTALKKASQDGCRCVYTGSGGDEVFAGYNFLVWSLGDRVRELRLKYALRGRYPELIIGKCLGVRVVPPYLTPEVLETALRVPPRCLRDDLMRGKEVLRHILRELGLRRIADRVKTPAEAGAGTDVLTEL